jgi:hypothetical protein
LPGRQTRARARLAKLPCSSCLRPVKAKVGGEWKRVGVAVDRKRMERALEWACWRPPGSALGPRR